MQQKKRDILRILVIHFAVFCLSRNLRLKLLLIFSDFCLFLHFDRNFWRWQERARALHSRDLAVVTAAAADAVAAAAAVRRLTSVAAFGEPRRDLSDAKCAPTKFLRE